MEIWYIYYRLDGHTSYKIIHDRSVPVYTIEYLRNNKNQIRFKSKREIIQKLKSLYPDCYYDKRLSQVMVK